jgi:threonine synthase
MFFYSTNNPDLRVDFREAVFRGLPEDNGLFMPEEIAALPAGFVAHLPERSFQEIGFAIAQTLMGDSIPVADLQKIIDLAINFPAPVVPITKDISTLELFHGPSLAFKDFGGQFMAQVMSYFNRGEDRDLVILVATSGDTGGAVAAGFYQTPGIKVVILYPSGKVSPLQEKQLTTLGHNILALEVDGTFDDCQALVKKAFLDPVLRDRIRLSSANSINIARLVPQSFYYAEAYKQVQHQGRPVVFSVPSGNFGNLTAGLLAKRMGVPVHHFLAATNANDVVPAYLAEGEYLPRPSVRTLSNAMDVGSPSNFARMLDLYGSTWNTMRQDISGYAYSDAETAACMQRVFESTNYVLDPHGAVGYLAAEAYRQQHPEALGVVLETAHPAKFLEDVERILGQKISVPERLAVLAHLEKVATPMSIQYADFREWLMAADL